MFRRLSSHNFWAHSPQLCFLNGSCQLRPKLRKPLSFRARREKTKSYEREKTSFNFMHRQFCPQPDGRRTFARVGLRPAFVTALSLKKSPRPPNSNGTMPISSAAISAAVQTTFDSFFCARQQGFIQRRQKVFTSARHQHRPAAAFTECAVILRRGRLWKDELGMMNDEFRQRKCS